ncbi:MAG TPA: thiamine-phosphate kinase, partial [Polyangiaceae bacterium]|nr:thiamine-phosphate kinase [Polyangiaceae bacterium]
MASTRPGSEFTRIALIERLLSANAPRSPAVQVGIGDDAAVLRCKGGLIWSIDAAVEGVHFERRWLTLQDVGYRAFQAALSDVAAMGARPLAALSNLALPRRFTSSELARLAEGQALAARDSRCPIVGGNLTRASELSVTTSVLGLAESPLLRSGARVGDELWLAGQVGLAAAGLAALQAGRRPRTGSLARCVDRWRRPSALIQDGLRLSRRASAAIDVSDGLVGDAEHLAEASGVRVIVDAEALVAGLSDDLLQAA